jgi:hypothetical protein
MAMMQQAIEHGTNGSDVAEQFTPVLDWAVRSQQRAESLVTPHHDFQEILRCGVWQLAHTEVIDDE